MKRLLVALLAVALLGLGGAVAQNINKAIQLSQDPTGVFGVDSNNNIYPPNHINGNAQASPTVTAAAGTVTISGTDLNGIVTGGSAATTTITGTWALAYGAKPSCVAQSENPATSLLAFVPSTTGFTVSSMGGAILHYVCMGIRK